jgi:hypothetical protein
MTGHENGKKYEVQDSPFVRLPSYTWSRDPTIKKVKLWLRRNFCSVSGASMLLRKRKDIVLNAGLRSKTAVHGKKRYSTKAALR